MVSETPFPQLEETAFTCKSTVGFHFSVNGFCLNHPWPIHPSVRMTGHQTLLWLPRPGPQPRAEPVWTPAAVRAHQGALHSQNLARDAGATRSLLSERESGENLREGISLLRRKRPPGIGKRRADPQCTIPLMFFPILRQLCFHSLYRNFVCFFVFTVFSSQGSVN